jgi:hypothetical protein
MLCWLLSLIALIRVVPSATVPGILDLQRPTDTGWQTYNNIALLVEAGGTWNSSELNGGTITTIAPGRFKYAALDNGASVRVDIRISGLREVQATATVTGGNVSKLALSNDYGIATEVRYVVAGSTYDARAYPAPKDGHFVSGSFYPVPPVALTLIGNGIIQYQRAVAPIEAYIEIRKTPWLPSQPTPEYQWIERAHLTARGGSTWTFGYAVQ